MLLERKLGRTGIDVTVLGLGCYQITEEFGVKQETASRILDYAMEKGITWYHTAAMYGYGESEELVGRALMRHKENPKLHCALRSVTLINRSKKSMQTPSNRPGRLTSQIRSI